MDDSSSDEELELLALAVVCIASRKRKRKHRMWVKEIFKNRHKDGIHNLVDVNTAVK